MVDKLKAGDYSLDITYRRSWWHRLFTRPWRPWPNAFRWEGDACVTDTVWVEFNPKIVGVMARHVGMCLEGEGRPTRRLVRA